MIFQRKLNWVETAALSVAVIAMTVGMALNTPFVAAPAGTSVPLVFVISTIGVLCIAASFVRLSAKVSHAGSVYGLIRYAQGRSFGFIGGWALFLTYGLFVSAAVCGFGLFASSLTDPLIHIPWPVYAFGAGAAVWLTNYRDIKLSTHVVLVIELFAIALMLLLSTIIVVHQPVTIEPFKVGGSGLVGFSQGLVFGIMTFVGFEAAASMGEEAKNPGRDIPFAVIATVLVAGFFFTFVSYAQTVGYGLADIKALSTAATPMSDLASRYVGAPMAMAITFCCAVSTFAMAVGSAAASSRLLLALSRDGFFPAKLASLNRFGSPGSASNVIMAFNAILLVILILWHNNASDLYGYTSTVATFTVIIAYSMMAVATLSAFWAVDLAQGKFYKSAPPIIGIILLAYTLFVNLYPIPDYPFNILPYIVIAYMGMGFVVLIPARRVKRQGEIDRYILDGLTSQTVITTENNSSLKGVA